MALTSTGLVIRRFPEVQEAIRSAVLQNVSTDIIFDEDLIITQLVDIIAAEVASLEEVLQAVYDSLDRDKAEGSSLDSLLNLIGLKRVGESFTSGNVTFIGDDNTTVPQGTILANPSTSDRFQTTAVGTLSQASCQSCDYQVTTVSDSTLYTVTVNGGNYSYTSDASATEVEIVTGLVNAINTPVDKTWLAETLVTPDRLRVASSNGVNITLVVAAGLTPERLVNDVPVASLVAGAIRAPEKSIITVITAVGGITSVFNPDPLGTGRERETDEEFRVRATQSLSLAGSATIPAITAALLNIDEVTSVFVEENVTSVTDGEGRPPKSFEAVVIAPDTTAINTSIATTIWENKPAGIETYGNTTEVIQDSTGRDQTINFSRPTSVFIATRVTYTLYSEELFPIDGPILIKNAVVAFGNSLPAGEDVIPKRFYGSIYSSVDGLEDIIVECQVLASQGDTPAGGSWSTAPIPVAQSSAASFDVGDVYTAGP